MDEAGRQENDLIESGVIESWAATGRSGKEE